MHTTRARTRKTTARETSHGACRLFLPGSDASRGWNWASLLLRGPRSIRAGGQRLFRKPQSLSRGRGGGKTGVGQGSVTWDCEL